MARLWTQLWSLLFPPSREAVIVASTTPDDLRRLRAQKFFGNIHSLLPYRHDTVRALIWQLKYRDDLRAQTLLGTLVREEVLLELQTPHLLIPIPLSPQRLRERGYNQVMRIATCATQGLPLVTIEATALTRTHAPAQTTLKRHERVKNVEGVFQVAHPTMVRGHDIILLDDVTTTGATLRAGCEALLQAGAHSVTCVALAH